MSTSVRQVLEGKGHDVVTIQPSASVLQALELMARTEVGALVVVDGVQIRGLFNERDYARKVVLEKKSSQATRVSEIMTTEVVCVGLDESIEVCMGLMTERRTRHLPVLDQDQLAGLVSIGDVVKAIMDEQKFTIENLERYIMGKL